MLTGRSAGEFKDDSRRELSVLEYMNESVLDPPDTIHRAIHMVMAKLRAAGVEDDVRNDILSDVNDIVDFTLDTCCGWY